MKEFVSELLVASQSSRMRIASSAPGARGSTPDKSQAAVSASSASSASASAAHEQPPQQSLAAASSGMPSQSPRPAEAEMQLPAGFSALEEELLASVAQLVRLVVHNAPSTSSTIRPSSRRSSRASATGLTHSLPLLEAPTILISTRSYFLLKL